MDSARKSELWGEVIDAYNLLGMSGFEAWINNYEGKEDEIKFLKGVRNYLYQENTSGNRIFSLRGINLESILNKVS